MEDNAITNFNLEMTEEPVTPEVNPTASTEGKTNGVKTGDLVASFSVLLILVALVVSVVLLLKRKRKLFIFEKRKRKITSGIIMMCTAASVLGFGSIAYAATNYEGWYDRQVQEIQEFNEVYNDGLLKVTTKIEGVISPKTGNVTCDNKICLTNLSDSGNIKINNVKAVKNSGFEDANIDNWTIKNYRQTLFDGDSTTEYVPNVTLEKNAEMEFSVTTKLSGQEAIDLNNTTPFNFVYDYKYVERKLNYMVSIWGIEEDKVYDEHHMAGLSFGPATGYSVDCLNFDGSAEHGHESGGHCICEDSWEEIIENCNNGNWEIYRNCLNYGCAKAVEIKENPDLFPMSTYVAEYTFSNFNNIILDKYSYNNMWHVDKKLTSATSEAANWATSRLRATYNGYDEEGSNFTPSIYAYEKGGENDCLTSENCFLSCFPESLQQSIVPKYFRVVSDWDFRKTYQVTGYTDVLDKLWAPGLSEVWGEGGADVYWEFGEFQYSKMSINGVGWGAEKGAYAVTWDSLHSGRSHSWTSSPQKTDNYKTMALNGNGFIASYNSCNPSPYFCLGCKEISLDNYSLEDLGRISKTIAKFGDFATFVNEFKDYQAQDKIWWSNSQGYFDSMGYDCSSAISNEDVAHCNQNYKNNFTDASGNMCEDRNRFVFLRILGIYEDYGLKQTSNATYIKMGLTFQCIHALPNAYKFSEGPVNTWYNSGLKTSLEECAEQLCDPFKNLIKKKFSFNNSTRKEEWYANSSYERLFLPSYSELWAKDKDTAIAPYDWYNNGRDEEGNIIFDPNDKTKLVTEGCCFSWAWEEKISGINANEKLKYLSVCNDGSLPANADIRGCWLRSVDSASTDKSFYIDLNGRMDCLESYDKYLCVAPSFCFGV